ncbi:hypothetical protein [Chlamydia caviae]|nr:hypothetical protein [Chlamydia caviae]
MRKYLICSLLAFFLPIAGIGGETSESLVFATLCISKNDAPTTSSWHFWKDPQVIRDEQHAYFLKQVISALKRPEIWNDPINLLHILLQFDKFSEKSGECHDLLLVIIRHRIMTLTMNMA